MYVAAASYCKARSFFVSLQLNLQRYNRFHSPLGLKRFKKISKG